MLLLFLSFTAFIVLSHSLPVSLDSSSEQPEAQKGRLLKRQYPYYPSPYAETSYGYSPYSYSYLYPYSYPYPQDQPQYPPLLQAPPAQAPPPVASTGFNPCAYSNSLNWKVDCNGGSFTKSTVMNGGFKTVQESGSFSVWKYGNPDQPFTQPFTTLGTNGGSSNNNDGGSSSCIGGLDSNGNPCSDNKDGTSGAGVFPNSGGDENDNGNGSGGNGTCVGGFNTVTGAACGNTNNNGGGGGGGGGTCTCDSTGLDCNGNACTPPSNTTASANANANLGLKLNLGARSLFLK